MRKQTLAILVISLLLVLCTGIPALAENMEEGFFPELFLVDDAYAPEKGELGIWLRPEYADYDEGSLTLINLAVEYGITDRLLMEVSYEGYKWINPEDAGVESESGTGDLSLGLMYAFGDEDAATHLAVGFEVTLSTGDFEKDLSEGYNVYEPFVAVSHDLASGASLHASLSYGIVDQQEKAPFEPLEEEDEVGIAVAYVHPLSDSLALMLEAAMESNEWLADGEETEGVAGPALVWQDESGLQLGVAVQFGLTDDSPNWSALLNIGKEFEIGGDD